MSSRPTRASVDGRTYLDLQRLARQSRRSTQDLLHLYALEGVLARLAISPHAERFVLKGGVLLAAYGTRRATRDVDLQARHLENDTTTVLDFAQEVASIGLDDGVTFQPDTATAHLIREDGNYQGVRVALMARLATARIGFHVDVNIGDPIWPAPQVITVPGLLGRDVRLKGYPLSMVYAEKLITGLERGLTNTRWRDFADVYSLSGQQPVAADELRGSLERVASYRQVTLVPLAEALKGWASSAQAKWATWRRNQLTLNVPTSFQEVLTAVINFADPVITGQTSGAWDPQRRAWHT